METGKGLVSGLFWGGVASMVLLTGASVYFPLRDLSERAIRAETGSEVAAPSRATSDLPFLADPPGADLSLEPDRVAEAAVDTAEDKPEVSSPSMTLEQSNVSVADQSETPLTSEAARDSLETAATDRGGDSTEALETAASAPPLSEDARVPLTTDGVGSSMELVDGMEAAATAPQVTEPLKEYAEPKLETAERDRATAPESGSPEPRVASVAPERRDAQPQSGNSPAQTAERARTDEIALDRSGGETLFAKPSLPAVAETPETLPPFAAGALPPKPAIGVAAPPVPPSGEERRDPDLGDLAGLAKNKPFVTGLERPAAMGEPPDAVPAGPQGLVAIAPPAPNGPVLSEAPDPASPQVQVSVAAEPPQTRTAFAAPAPRADQLRAPLRPRATPAVVSRPPLAPQVNGAPTERPREATPEPASAPVALPEIQTAQPARPVIAAPRILLGAGSDTLVSRGPGLSARMPRIGELAPQAVSLTPEAANPAPVGALARNARAFTPPDGTRAVISILLDLTGDVPAVREALADASSPFAVALDPTLPEAPDRAADLRDNGHEVLISLTGLPPNPEPRDIDVALAAHIARLPGAVGVWLPAESPAFTNRTLLRHTVAVLADTGHGLVTPRTGLDAAGQEARSVGLPAVSVSRQLEGSESTALLRSLAQGALQAGVTGRYVVQASPDAASIAIMGAWSAGLEAQSLAVAPVSQLMLSTAP